MCGLKKDRCDAEKARKHLVSFHFLAVVLLGQQDSLDVGKNTTTGDRDSSKKLVQLLVVSDSQLQMSGDDPGLLVVTGSVTSQLKDLS